MSDVRQCVYKYVYKGSIIYIGKTNSSLKNRVRAHEKEKKFIEYLNDAKIYFVELKNKAETSFMEKCLINKYRPILNITDVYNSDFKINIDEPEWTEFLDTDKRGNNYRYKTFDESPSFERLKLFREDNDLRQVDIAEHLGITQRAYSHYESGDRHIPIEILIKLAELYETSVDYLLNRTDEKNRH